jgi:NADH:ubiquinone oxidoreductase subunit D
MHSGYLRTGAVSHYIPSFLVEEVILLCTDVPIKLQEIHNIITNNRIWLARLVDVGLMSKYFIELYALSGVMLRASHFRKDLRLIGYSYYSRIEWNVVLGIKGDSMDRYLVRMNESLESVKILNTCSLSLTTWYLSNNYTEGLSGVLTNMESMIHYFKLVTEGYTFTLGQTYLR